MVQKSMVIGLLLVIASLLAPVEGSVAASGEILLCENCVYGGTWDQASEGTGEYTVKGYGTFTGFRVEIVEDATNTGIQCNTGNAGLNSLWNACTSNQMVEVMLNGATLVDWSSWTSTISECPQPSTVNGPITCTHDFTVSEGDVIYPTWPEARKQQSTGDNGGQLMVNIYGIGVGTQISEATCQEFTCPDGMRHKDGIDNTIGNTADVCCQVRMCSEYTCSDEDGDHIIDYSTTEGYTFDTCCTCNYGSKLFYGAVAVGDYIVNGASGDGTPTMSITLPIPSDITVTELTWYQGDGSGDYTPANVNSWEVTDVNPCKKHYTYTKTIPTFFGSGSKWSIEGNAIFATITMAGTKAVTETFGTYTETYQRSVRHAIGIQVGLTTTSSVTANFYIESSLPEGDQYFFVTGIVDNFAADGSEVVLTMVLKTGDCVKEIATLAQGGDYVVAANTDISFGAASLDDNDHCQQEVTFKFKPKTCFDSAQNFQLDFTTRNDVAFNVNMEVNIECASFLDNLPILATLTFHASQDTLDVEQTTFQLGEEVYALLDTSTLVPLTNIEIEKVVVVQDNYSGVSVDTQLKPVVDDFYLYTDVYPAPGQGADTAMMSWDLESTHFTVSASGSIAKTMVDFTVTYDQSYTFRRSLEVDTKFPTQERRLMELGGPERRVLEIDNKYNDPELNEKEFGYSDEMLGEFKIVDEGAVGVEEVDSSPRNYMKYVAVGVFAAAALVFYRQRQVKAEKQQVFVNMYHMEQDVF